MDNSSNTMENSLQREENLMSESSIPMDFVTNLDDVSVDYARSLGIHSPGA